MKDLVPLMAEDQKNKCKVRVWQRFGDDVAIAASDDNVQRAEVLFDVIRIRLEVR